MSLALYGMGTAITWGLGSVLIKTQVGKLPALALLALRAVAGGVTALVAVAILGRWGEMRHIPVMVWLAALGAVVSGYFAADLLFVRALDVVPLSQAQPIQATYPLVAALIAWVVLREPVTTWILLGAFVVALGVLFVASEGADSTGPQGKGRRWGLMLLGLSTLGWGASAVFLRVALQERDAVAINGIVGLLAALVFLMGTSPRSVARFAIEDRRGSALLALAGVIGGTGISNLLFILAIEAGGVTAATALACTAPLFTALLAVVLLRERVTLRLGLGTGLTVLGAFMILGG